MTNQPKADMADGEQHDPRGSSETLIKVRGFVGMIDHPQERGWSLYRKDGIHCLAENLYEDDADRIIADHTAAANVAEVERQLAVLNLELDRRNKELLMVSVARDNWMTEATRRGAQLATARADAGVLYGLLDWLLTEMPACDKDGPRDYCVTHYTQHCAVEAKIAEARIALAHHVSLAGETTDGK